MDVGGPVYQHQHWLLVEAKDPTVFFREESASYRQHSEQITNSWPDRLLRRQMETTDNNLLPRNAL